MGWQRQNNVTQVNNMNDSNGIDRKLLERYELLAEVTADRLEQIHLSTAQLPDIAKEIRQLRAELIDVLCHKLPRGQMSVDTHTELIRTLNRTYLLLIVAALGILKGGPAIEQLVNLWLPKGMLPP